jgi:hypothetical protein
LGYKLATEEIEKSKEHQMKLHQSNLALKEHLDSLKFQLNERSVTCISVEVGAANSEESESTPDSDFILVFDDGVDGPLEETNSYFDKFEMCISENTSLETWSSFRACCMQDYSNCPSSSMLASSSISGDGLPQGAMSWH